jgi:hypothetical protein
MYKSIVQAQKLYIAHLPDLFCGSCIMESKSEVVREKVCFLMCIEGTRQ